MNVCVCVCASVKEEGRNGGLRNKKKEMRREKSPGGEISSLSFSVSVCISQECERD